MGRHATCGMVKIPHMPPRARRRSGHPFFPNPMVKYLAIYLYVIIEFHILATVLNNLLLTLKFHYHAYYL